MAASLQVGYAQPRLRVVRMCCLFLAHIAMTAAAALAVTGFFLDWWQWYHPLIGLVCVVWMGESVTVYLHRGQTHKSYQLTKWWGKWIVELFWIIGAMAALQGTIIQWVFWHLFHHKHSDKEGDLHSPVHNHLWGHLDSRFLNWLWAHFVWLLYAPEPDAATRKRRAREGWLAQVADNYLGMIILGPVVMLTLTYIVGGWQGMVWYLAAAFTCWHVTGLINSICHSPPRDKKQAPNPKSRDYSVNRIWLVLLSFGEAWHGLHHEKEGSALLGPRWWLDHGYWPIWCMRQIGFARKVKAT